MRETFRKIQTIVGPVPHHVSSECKGELQNNSSKLMPTKNQ